jgi:hypothetical protein
MDLLLKRRKTSRILGELVGPKLLLLLELRMNAPQRLLGRWNGRAGLGAKTEEHRTVSLILLSHLSFYA